MGWVFRAGFGGAEVGWRFKVWIEGSRLGWGSGLVEGAKVILTCRGGLRFRAVFGVQRQVGVQVWGWGFRAGVEAQGWVGLRVQR